MKIRTILFNLVIILSLCFLTFAVLDWYNPMMNFSGNTISSKLLLALCVSAIVLAVLTLLPENRNLCSRPQLIIAQGVGNIEFKKDGTRFSPSAVFCRIRFQLQTGYLSLVCWLPGWSSRGAPRSISQWRVPARSRCGLWPDLPGKSDQNKEVIS